MGELVAQWRADLDASATAALCAALAEQGERNPGSLDAATALGIGAEVEPRFASDPTVQMAVGRMYMACGELKRALKPLAVAARGAAASGAFSLLGELLLRLGDARRAVQAFERALGVRPNDPELRSWLSSAQSYVRLQEEQGADAVAREVERVTVEQAPDDDGGVVDPPTLVVEPRTSRQTDAAPDDPPSRARRPLPSFTELSPGRVVGWGDESTQVTSMTRIVASRGESVSSDEEMPTAVRDPEAVLSLLKQTLPRASDPDFDLDRDVLREDELVTADASRPAKLVSAGSGDPATVVLPSAAKAAAAAPAARVGDAGALANLDRTVALEPSGGGISTLPAPAVTPAAPTPPAASTPPATASDRELRPNPALAPVDVAIRPGVPLPATSDRILPVALGEAPRTELPLPSSAPSRPAPPVTKPPPPPSRGLGAGRIVVAVVLVIVAVSAGALAAGWLPSPAGFGRSATPAATEPTPPAPSAETTAVPSTSSGAEPAATAAPEPAPSGAASAIPSAAAATSASAVPSATASASTSVASAAPTHTAAASPPKATGEPPPKPTAAAAKTKPSATPKEKDPGKPAEAEPIWLGDPELKKGQ